MTRFDHILYDIILFWIALLPSPLVYRIFLAGHQPPQWRISSLLSYVSCRNIDRLSDRQYESLSYCLSCCLETPNNTEGVRNTLGAWIKNRPKGYISLAIHSNSPSRQKLYGEMVNVAINHQSFKVSVELLDQCMRSLIINPDFTNYATTVQDFALSGWESLMASARLSNMVKLLDFVSNGNPMPQAERPVSFILSQLEVLLKHLPNERQRSQQEIGFLNAYLRQLRLTNLAPAQQSQFPRKLPCM